ncbi:MAG: methionine adenosyltransferase [Bacilli bacterium]
MYKKIFTSESVSEGHPDKVCDQISDAILDEILKQDSNARVACETFVTTQKVVVGGEVRTSAKINYEKVVRDTLREIGYVHEDLGIGCDSCDIEILLHEQSADIALGVDAETNAAKEIGAGDQGIMFGFACKETKEFMPLPIMISHKLVQYASEVRKSGDFKWSRPDMKSQVTIDYSKDVPRVDTVLMSIQHDEDYDELEFKNYIKSEIIDYVLSTFDIDSSDYKLLLNPTGKFVIGGPCGDAGLTGRKIIVDTYGGFSRHGGGAFSGKDATKVDRSAAYAARYVAKNIVAANLCDMCEIQLSYAIGVASPVSVLIETFGTHKVEIEKIVAAVNEVFDLEPAKIIEKLKLNQPIFKQTAKYGHMGREDINVSWESLDKVDELKNYIG